MSQITWQSRMFYKNWRLQKENQKLGRLEIEFWAETWIELDFLWLFKNWFRPSVESVTKKYNCIMVSQENDWSFFPLFSPVPLSRDHPYITSAYFCLFGPHPKTLSALIQNVSQTGNFLDPPTQSFCWRNIGMVP